MALLFMDGFDAGDYLIKWSNYNNSIYLSLSTVTRFGTGRSLRLNRTAYYIAKDFVSTNEIIVGTAYRTSLLSSSGIVIQLSGSATHISVGVTSTGSIAIWRGTSTLLAESAANLIITDAWNYLEAKALIDDVNGHVEVRCNGVLVVSYSGDTRNGGTDAFLTRLILVSNVNDYSYFDDLYICDALGSAPYNDFLGDVRVAALSPNAAGNTTQFSATGDNYTHVDELPYSATDYVSGAGTGTKDTYGMSDLPTGATTIYGLQTNIIAKKSDAGNMSLAPVVRSASTDYVGTATALGSSDLSLRSIYETDPATSTAWTESGVNSHEAGMEVG